MNNLYIGNLDLLATENEIRSLLMLHGNVEAVTLIKDRCTGNSLGVALVEMATAAQAEAARDALDKTIYRERQLDISHLEQRANTSFPVRPWSGRLAVQKIAALRIRRNQRCTVVYERTRTGWISYSPEVPGCIALANTLTKCKARIFEKLKSQVAKGKAIRKMRMIREHRHLVLAQGGYRPFVGGCGKGA